MRGRCVMRRRVSVVRRTRAALHRVRAVHRARVQHPRIAEDDGEPEREQRGDGAVDATHLPRIYANCGAVLACKPFSRSWCQMG